MTTKPTHSPNIKNVKTTVYKPDKSKVGYELLSYCCNYPPLGGIWSECQGDITGRCSKCKDGSGFEWVKNED